VTTLPTFVTRILDDLGQRQLAGDLAEELSAGRSRGWLWWQVGAAIIAALVDTIRQRPYLTLRAVAVGWTTVMLVEGWVRGRWPFLPRPEFPEWVRQAQFFRVALDAAAYFVSGWVVARVHRQNRLALVLITMLSMTLINAIFIGWRTYDMLTHPPVYAPMMEQRLLLHSVISFLLPLLVLNITISLLLPLLVAVGGGFPGISRQPKPIRG
jgi:hypothetical protein